MYRKIIFPLSILVLGVMACNLSSSNIPNATPTTEPVAATIQAPISTQVPALTSAVSRFPLPDLLIRFPPPPILPIPKSSIQFAGEAFDAYQMAGDRFRVLCKQPCSLDERMMDALYAAYKVAAQEDVRTAGFDVLDKYSLFDIHLDRDKECTRYEGELGLTTAYPDNPNSIVICLYLTDPEIQAGIQADPNTSFSPEGAIRSGGLGVFAHEYAHALLLGRFASSHDFVFPIEYVTNNPDKSAYYGNLCESLYQNSAPLSYQLCQKNGFTFDQMIQSLLDINRLYDAGVGNQQDGRVGYNQYWAILENILGSDVTQAFNDAGYQKILNYEGNAPYTLPYAGEPCTYRAHLINDGTIPLGTTLDANAPFDKTWRIKNTGMCNWDGVQLVYVRGEAMTTSTGVNIPATPAGGELDVTVPMTAPADPGVHAGEWRLRSSSGLDFGPIFNLVVYTRPGCSFPPELSFFKAEPATIGPGALALLTWGQVTNADRVEITGLGSVDSNGNRLLVQPDQTTIYTLQATCGSQMASLQATVTVDPSLPPFSITSLTAVADPANFNGSCGNGKKIQFTGGFTSTAPGVVLYQWGQSDSSTSSPVLFVFDKAGMQTVTGDWSLSGTIEGYWELKIVAPVESDPVRANFNLTCTP